MLKIGNICKFQSGGTPSKKNPEYYNGNIPWITTVSLIDNYIDENNAVEYITSEAIKNSAAKIVPKDSIMIGTRVGIGKTAINCVEMSTSQDIVSLIDIDENRWNKCFLCLFFKSKRKYLLSQSRGATIKGIKIDTISNLELPTYSIDEQKEIVSTLDTLQSIITHRRTQLEKLDLLIKARFVEMCNANPSCNLLSEFISKYNAERCGERDLPVLSITKNAGIVLQSEKFSKRIASIDSSTYKIVPRGKLVQGIHIDERNFDIQDVVDLGIVSPAYKIWSVNDEKCIPKVLAFALRTDKTMEYIKSKFTGSVKRRESISYEDFMNTPIDLPSYNVQTQFADFVKQVDKSKATVQKALDEAQLLFDSLMQEYFG